MEFFINCNTSSLAPYTTPLDGQRAQHLYRRLGFSASVQTINQAIGQTAGTLVNSLISEAQNMPPLAAPIWADWNNSNYPEDDDARGQMIRSQQEEFKLAYTNDLLENNLRDRLSFFWSNHFVTELDVYNCNSFLYHYINCLQRNAIGNFKTFVSEIGLTSAMLYYLDGVYNNGSNPNENYARELYELFTLGEGNGYTEQDIVETAKALSGYVERGELGCEQVTFDASKFNSESKTIFGRTGNWGYNDVIDILFEERANEIGYFICKKLYEFFVHPDSTDEANNAKTIIDGLTATFISNNFELAPVLSQLFKSQHFFDDEAIGVIIKSPFDLYLNTIKETGFAYNDTTLGSAINYSGMLGQDLFDPFDVAGWQRNRDWINTNFMIGRWLTMETIMDGFYQDNPDQFTTFAMDAVGPANSNTSNPEIVVQAIIDKITPKGMFTQQDFDNAMSAFLIEDVPEEYYSPDFYPGGNSTWVLSFYPSVPLQVYLLLRHLTRQPEFQLK
ncbi:DUF1800 domain-containing protein [Arenibacter sp. M-2]|uniref:DUF1800 domain-containing protein n=1 Tax=unclassified Arenibacter TaxID=2615047 RepID=UPI000D760B56|nr:MULTISPECIES: DUF1800 domain-containing protein [unclassified Arenibacter]MDL5514109.1 DUF1800 domain-containing protein [Arenibacter sp. M-2]PXX30564.1 uncharacterized protein DUF1800 [Arenibacter sp. ARW7G5Y1]|tara:strand:- start:7571 stop:9079 length:1509 start_codon:yes stop_codon:yes gene_type:complete